VAAHSVMWAFPPLAQGLHEPCCNCAVVIVTCLDVVASRCAWSSSSFPACAEHQYLTTARCFRTEHLIFFAGSSSSVARRALASMVSLRFPIRKIALALLLSLHPFRRHSCGRRFACVHFLRHCYIGIQFPSHQWVLNGSFLLCCRVPPRAAEPSKFACGFNLSLAIDRMTVTLQLP
jgi:hypothetical protein